MCPGNQFPPKLSLPVTPTHPPPKKGGTDSKNIYANCNSAKLPILMPLKAVRKDLSSVYFSYTVEKQHHGEFGKMLHWDSMM